MQDTYQMFFPWPTNDVNPKLLQSMETQCRASAQALGHITVGKATFIGINRREDTLYPFEYEFGVKLRQAKEQNGEVA